MKKKFLSAVLFGAMTFAATSTFVSCKDYDDDINSLRGDVTSLQSQASALDAALKQAQSDATAAKAAAAQAAQAAADAQKAAATAQSVGDAAQKAAEAAQKAAEAASQAAKEAAATAKAEAIAEAQKMVNDLQTQVNNKVDQSVYDAKIKEIASKLEAIDGSLNKLTTALSDKADKADLTNEEVARKAAIADLQEQLDDLKNLGENTTLAGLTATVQDLQKTVATLATKTDLTALQTKVDGLTTQLNTLGTTVSNHQTAIDAIQKQLETAASIQDVQDMMQKADDQLKADIEKEFAAITPNIDVLNVFVKQRLTSLVFKPVFYYGGVEAMEAATLEYNKIDLNPYTLSHRGETWTSAGTLSNITPAVVAEYHLNPSCADITAIKDLKFISDDKDYIAMGTRDAKCDPQVASFSANGGILSVKLNLDASKIATSKDQITVMALQANIAAQDGKKDTTITSDYAALCKSTLKDFEIVDDSAHKETATGLLGIKAPICLQGNGKLEPFHVYTVAAEAIDSLPTHYLLWDNSNGGFDLKKVVTTHYNAGGGIDTKIMSDVSHYGLKYFFDPAEYLSGSNNTSESVHMYIENGVAYACMPKTLADGKTTVADKTTQNKASIGRMPMVRVTLRDTTKTGNPIVSIGYIKLKITDKVTVPTYPEAIQVPFSFGPAILNCDGVTYTTTWAQVEAQVLARLNMSKAEFEASYDLQYLTNPVCKQYVYQTDNPKNAPYKEVEIAKYTGEVKNLVNGPDHETDVLQWTLTGENLDTITTPASVYVLYEAKDHSVNSDVYVKLTLTDVTRPKATFDGKISNYWAALNSELGSGKDEIHNNVEVVGQTNADCEFINDINNTIVGNWPSLTLNGGFTSFTSDKLGLSYKFIEPTKKTVTGISGDRYNLSVSASGLALIATKVGTAVFDTVAILTDGPVGTSTKGQYQTIYPGLPTTTQTAGLNSVVVYQENDFAKDVLNYAGHKDLANTFTARVGLTAGNGCDMNLPITNGQFDMKFLRPINAEGAKEKYITDAVDGGSKIAIAGLVDLTDWRDYKFTALYYQYYGVTAITPDLDKATTTLNGGTLGTTLLSKVTNQITLTTDAATVIPDGITVPNYGNIYYENNGSALSDFQIRVPLTVTYKWGYVTTYVDITVSKTVHNAPRK